MIFKCRECFGILLSSAFQCILKLFDYHKKCQWKLSLKSHTRVPNFERFSFTRKWLWTPILFEPNYLSSPWTKSKYPSAYQIDNFWNFSKLTQLLSVGKFLRPLGAFKINWTHYLAVLYSYCAWNLLNNVFKLKS